MNEEAGVTGEKGRSGRGVKPRASAAGGRRGAKIGTSDPAKSGAGFKLAKAGTGKSSASSMTKKASRRRAAKSGAGARVESFDSMSHDPAAAPRQHPRSRRYTRASQADLEIVDPAAFAKGSRVRTPTKGEVGAVARVVRAQKELNQLAERRLIYQAAKARTSQSAIAALLGTSQPTVSRIAKQIEHDPSLLEPSPSEMIFRRAVGQIDTETMMKTLLSYAYSSGTYDPTGGDGFVRGDWRQVEGALVAGLISDKEYERIAREAPVKSAGADH